MGIELQRIPLEYYFNTGDDITCYECGTEYIIIFKSPAKLSILLNSNSPDNQSPFGPAAGSATPAAKKG